MSLIEELPSAPTKYFKKLVNTDDIWEVRVSYANNTFRFLGFFDEDKLVILNHAFQKKSQKTPRRDIKIAEERKNEYFKRRNQND